MMNQDVAQVTATNNLFAETMRYFQHLPPKRVRDAERLGKHADEAIDVFGFNKEKRQ